MPPILKKRGRPKGHELTSIGLPAKRARKGQNDTKPKVVPFVKIHTSIKEKGSYSVESLGMHALESPIYTVASVVHCSKLLIVPLSFFQLCWVGL